MEFMFLAEKELKASSLASVSPKGFFHAVLSELFFRSDFFQGLKPWALA